MQRDGGRKKSDKIISCKGTERKGLWKGGRERESAFVSICGITERSGGKTKGNRKGDRENGGSITVLFGISCPKSFLLRSVPLHEIIISDFFLPPSLCIPKVHFPLRFVPLR